MDIVVAIIGTLILAQFIDGRLAAAIGLVSVVAFRLWRRRQVGKAIAELGLSPEEFSSVQQELQRGDKAAAERRIAVLQERKRAEFELATGIDSRTITPEIGQQISWADIVRHVFLVSEFDRAGTTIGPNDEVQALSPFKPYGYLLVESPILSQRVRLPIIHRDDFLLAASVFDEPEFADLITQEELLVTYAPKKLLPKGLTGGPSHVLHYVITPYGTLDRYYAKDNDVHMRKPEPERLFGPFVYEGEIRVQVNPEPKP